MPATNHNRCLALMKSGKRCRAASMQGGLCFLHANPKKASEIGRIGGRKNRHLPTVEYITGEPLTTPSAIREALARLLSRALAGQLDPKIAKSVPPLLNLQLRAMEMASSEEFAREIRDLQERVARLSKPDPEAAPAGGQER